MTSIIVRASLITLLCIAASLAIVVATDGELTGPGLWVPVICCLVTAFPGSMFTLWQVGRLRSLNAALSQAHIELNAAHAKLAEKASRDAMTGFLNREAIFGELERTRRQLDRGVLLLVDADHFKRVNDEHGHLSGDEALMLISGAIRRSVREGDHVGRIGGEEFAIYLAGANLSDATEIAERLRAEVERLVFMPRDGLRHRLTVSIGGAYCGHNSSVSDIMRTADRRLYTAKNAGRNRAIIPVSEDLLAA